MDQSFIEQNENLLFKKQLPLEECADDKIIIPTQEKLERDDKAEAPVKRKKILYLLIFGAFLVQFFVLGMLNNFGVLKAKWKMNAVGSDIMIDQTGSVNYGVLYISGILFGYLVNKIGVIYVYLIGCFLSAASLISCTYFQNFIPIFISYGIFYGLGAGFMFFTTIYVQTKYFEDIISIVTGFVAAGSCFGTMALSLGYEVFFVKFGWKNVLRMYGLLIAILSLISLIFNIPQFTKDKNKKTTKEMSYISKKSSLSSYSTVLTNGKFILLSVSSFIFMLGYLIPSIFLKSFAESRSITSKNAATLIGYYSISSFFGRFFFGFLGNYLKEYQIYLLMVSFLCMGIGNLISSLCKNFMFFLVYVVFVGFFDAGYVILPIPIINSFFSKAESDVKSTEENKSMVTKAIGLFFLVKSIAVMVGPLIGSFLITKINNYSILFSIAGSTAIISSFLLGFIRCLK